MKDSRVSSLFLSTCSLVTHRSPEKYGLDPFVSKPWLVAVATTSSSLAVVSSTPIFPLLALSLRQRGSAVRVAFQHSRFSFASSSPLSPWRCCHPRITKHSYPNKLRLPKNGPLLPNCTTAALACSTVLGPQALS